VHICLTPIDFHTDRKGGGIASYIHSISTELSRRGHEVTIIAKGRKKKWHHVNDLCILFWPFGELHYYLYKMKCPGQCILPLRETEWSRSLYRAVREVHRKSPVDIIEACEAGIRYLHRLGIPWIVRLHGEAYMFAKFSGLQIHRGIRECRRMELSALRKASGITSPSRFQADTLGADKDGHFRPVEVIPNPVDPEVLHYAGLNNKTEKDPNLVLYTGRIEYRKGVIPLLQSVPFAAGEFPHIHYVLAGDRHNSIPDQMLNSVLNTDDISKHVTLTGHIAWSGLFPWYQKASIFVMPSFYETFGISCIEAMAFELPVVAASSGGLPEVVEHGVTGLCVPPGDPKALAEAIKTLMRQPGLRRRLGRAGREKVRECYQVDKIVDAALSYYQYILDGQPCAS